MKRLLFAVALFFTALGFTTTAEARRGHDHVSVYASFGGGYYEPSYYGYSPYYSPYYVAPPPVVYAVPPAYPVVYEAPPPQTVIVSGPPVEPTVAANQTSPTYIDNYGRTCRHYQATTGGPAYGTACLQPDGSWRAVQ